MIRLLTHFYKRSFTTLSFVQAFFPIPGPDSYLLTPTHAMTEGPWLASQKFASLGKMPKRSSQLTRRWKSESHWTKD